MTDCRRRCHLMRKLQSGATLSPYPEAVRGALRKITPNGGKVRYKE
jgi:hypothetical protein